jgi:hypothetical protein
MRPTSGNERDGRGRGARLLTTRRSALTAMGVTLTLIALTSGIALSQDARPQEPRDAQAPPVATPYGDTGEFPELPYIKTPVDEPKALHEVYMFAAEHPEVVQYMPCFCACGKNKTHKSLENCFLKSRGETPKDLAWSAHGGECMICVSVAAEARRLHLQGLSVAAIRDEIERTLAPKFKFHTDTPMPPGHPSHSSHPSHQ